LLQSIIPVIYDRNTRIFQRSEDLVQTIRIVIRIVEGFMHLAKSDKTGFFGRGLLKSEPFLRAGSSDAPKIGLKGYLLPIFQLAILGSRQLDQ